METHCTPLERSGTLPSSVRTLLEEASSLASFHNFPPSPEGYDRAIEARELDPKARELLQNRLLAQYESGRIKPEGAVRKNIDALTEPSTYTVTTGHQLCLFSGPLLFIHKALHTIKLAESLRERHPDKHFVPVHWMASEDHDLPEVDHIVMNGKEWKWKTDQKGAVGRMKLEGIEQLFGTLREELASFPNGEEWVGLLEKSYGGETKDLADATRAFLNEILGEHGLVVIDGDDVQLKGSFVPDMVKEFEERRAERCVEKSSSELEEGGHKRQVNPRPINLFYLREGYRERIEAGTDAFYTVDGTYQWTKEEILSELDKNPERFSPNVILRPLYQERILPNIAYVGGPAETAYWLQLKGLFDEGNAFFPVLQPRHQIFHIDGKNVKLLQELGIGPEELLCGKEELFKGMVRDQQKEELDIGSEKEQLDRLYEALAQKAASIDPNLWDSSMAEKRKVEKGLERLSKKMLRHAKKKEETLRSRLERLYAHLFPDGVPQERSENLGPYYAREGKGFLRRTLHALPSFHAHIVWLPEKGT